MKIVTGYTGTPHISSNDDQGQNQGVFGRNGYVLDAGNNLNATLTNATTVTLSDGDGVIQGVHFRIDPGMTEAVSISPGTTGYNRIDLICAKYTKEASTGVEDVDLVVVQGTSSASTPSEPTYTEGDILAGDTLAYAPLWKVTISGLTPSLSRYAPVLPSLNDLAETTTTHASQIDARQIKAWTKEHKDALVSVNSSTMVSFPQTISFAAPTEVSFFAYIYAISDDVHPAAASAIIWINGNQDNYFYVDIVDDVNGQVLLHAHFIANSGDELKIGILGDASGQVAVDVDMWTRVTGLS